jgi:hypothetical protein
MDNNRKIEILEDMKIFFRNHQRYEMAAHIALTDYLGGTDKTRQTFLSDHIKDLTIRSFDEYKFMIGTIESYVPNQFERWTMDQYKNLILSKQIKRFLKIQDLGI